MADTIVCPCYKCLFTDPLKARRCNPGECKQLTEWINRLVEPQIISRRLKKPSVVCPKCGSARAVKSGFSNGAERDGGHQLYKCKNCRKRFRPGYGYRMNTRQEIIDYALELSEQLEPALSTRDISKRIRLTFDVHVSHVSVAKWLKN